MADVIYNSFKKKIMDGGIDLVNDTIKVMLVISAYVPDQDLHDFKDDITDEVVGTGYTAGGAALANKTVTQDNTDDEGVFNADDVTWPDSTITARGAVVYKDTGTPATSPVLCYIDFGADKSSNAGNFVIQWNAEGILNFN
ncbi:MAG TPA: hypothetical protein ENH31_00305 [Nitrospirae bacterium]|nr:hypothetical protein [Nitrospirota bacterium]HDK80993.1 hypothetical protein [Nitrospirota bacterium]